MYSLLRIITFFLTAVSAVHLRTTKEVVETAVHGQWLQVYSDWYVQSTSEIDYSCVTVEIASVGDTDIPTVTISKRAYQHGNIHQPAHWAHSYTLSWKLDDATIFQDNLVLTPTVNSSSVLVPLWLRRTGDDYLIWTGLDNKTMYVWTHTIPDPAENSHILHQLAELDFNGTYKTPLSSYSASCLP